MTSAAVELRVTQSCNTFMLCRKDATYWVNISNSLYIRISTIIRLKRVQ